jgi:hypothetical protein
MAGAGVGLGAQLEGDLQDCQAGVVQELLQEGWSMTGWAPEVGREHRELESQQWLEAVGQNPWQEGWSETEGEARVG